MESADAEGLSPSPKTEQKLSLQIESVAKHTQLSHARTRDGDAMYCSFRALEQCDNSAGHWCRRESPYVAPFQGF
ncbi:hypothetical protein CsSME_00019729 [Camellia sinensis var. sinensis]